MKLEITTEAQRATEDSNVLCASVVQTVTRSRDRVLLHNAHAVFDRLWQRIPAIEGARWSNDKDGFSRRCLKARRRAWRRARNRAYRWLARQLGIAPERCHFRYFDDATLRRAIALCKTARPEDIASARLGTGGARPSARPGAAGSEQ